MNGKLRTLHQRGRHILAFADGGADWCRRCGTFDCYIENQTGPTECHPVKRTDRFWPQRKKATA